MRTSICKLKRFSFLQSFSNRWLAVLAAALIIPGLMRGAGTTVVTTMAGGQPGLFYGYRDGSTLHSSLYHTPCGLAISPALNCLFVADRDNNVMRYLDLAAGLTWTLDEPTNTFRAPVGVVVDDSTATIFVLNRGGGTNGNVVELDNYGEFISTNATKLTNAAGITMDSSGTLYVTAFTNTIYKIIPGVSAAPLITITIPGTVLQGIVARADGSLAVCDSGRMGIYSVDPVALVVGTNAGFHGVGDFTTNSTDTAFASRAKFNGPMGICETGDGNLLVTDSTNNRVKVVLQNGVVTNLYGVTRQYWSGTYPGWFDGTVFLPESTGDVQGRMQNGICFGPDGTVYTDEDYYHTIRKTTGAGFGLPATRPTQVNAPQIGYVTFPETAVNPYTSVFHPVTNTFIFNNDTPIIIESVAGSQTYYNYADVSSLGLVPDPTTNSFSAPQGYIDGLFPSQVTPLAVATTLPFVAIKAMSTKNDGSPDSPVVSALFEYVVANPVVTGINGAQFTVSDATANAHLYYTIDGSTPSPTNGVDLGVVASSTNDISVSLIVATNVNFQIRGYRNNYQPSSTVTTVFTTANFVADSLTFGFANGEASSAFIGAPGQTFYAPVTMSVLPNTTIFAMQFNIMLAAVGGSPQPIPGAFGFTSMLEKPIPGTIPALYTNIPPMMYVGNGQFTNLEVVNTNLNLLGLGWVERSQQTNLYDTLTQDLIQFSQAHDDQYLQANGKIIVGGYGFTIPANAVPGQQYQIQLGRASASSDGVGAPGSAVYLSTPTNGSLGAGSVSALKLVTAGQIFYLVGDAYPFRWFNAGDFGTGELITNGSSDVVQVFESAVYGWNTPPTNTDFYDCMDSAGNYGVWDAHDGYYTNAGALTLSQETQLFNNNDPTVINTNMFGDGQLDVADVYVTFLRSISPTNNSYPLYWVQRFWTNGIRAALLTGNPSLTPEARAQAVPQEVTAKVPALTTPTISITNIPKVVFTAGDYQGTSNQIQIPISASVFGSYPLRMLMMGLSVVPLDGSPALTQAVTFTPSATFGTPYTSSQQGLGNYAAVWLNNAIKGLTGTGLVGTLTITLPANAPSSAAYVIHFDHASGSPSGLASFPNQKFPGLITLSSRTNSSYGDGIPDSWRLRWFGTVDNVLSVSNACASGDGVDNWQKYIAGVDPTIPNNFPKLQTLSAAPTGFVASIHWPTVEGKQYLILRSSDQFHSQWTTISTNIGTGTEMEYDDNSNAGVSFYRVLISQ